MGQITSFSKKTLIFWKSIQIWGQAAAKAKAAPHGHAAKAKAALGWIDKHMQGAPKLFQKFLFQITFEIPDFIFEFWTSFILFFILAFNVIEDFMGCNCWLM